TDVIAALEEVCAHHGIKGAIIKKGVGKRVLIPLVLLLLVAAGAVYYFATKGETEEQKQARLDNIRKREEAEEAARRERERTLAQARETRKQEALNRLGARERSELSLRLEYPLEAVYDEPASAPMKESKWIALAKDFEVLAGEDSLKEFEDELELSSKANRHATEIRNGLDKWKESADDRREKQAAKLAEAKQIDAKQRSQLAEMRARRQYQLAANLCDRAAADKPSKEDPFANVTTWTWVSPVDPSLKRPALDFGNIKDFLAESRKYFQNERPAIIKEAQTVGNAIIEEAKALPREADPAALDAAIKKLETVRAFRDEEGEKVPEIETLVAAARDLQGKLETVVAERTAKHTADDRVRVRDLQRKLCSLDPDMTSLVMNCGYSDAINTWQKVLADDQIRTDVYKRFVRERIAMLQWCQFLFARFEVDVAMTDGGAGKPLKLLALEQVPFKDGDMKDVTLQRNKEPNERYKFTTDKQHSRQYVFEYGQFPMDWVYNSVFLHLNEPRWQQMTPEIQFALGAFCFETMQYADAAHCFDEVLKSGNGALATAARSLKGRAEREAKARAAYEAILKEFAAATTAAEVEALKKKVDSYRGEYEGTIFYIDVMDPANKDDLMKTEFYSADYPEVPPAPPPPERES
ncbi:MAG TPA: hypothetical protein VFY93_07145, partial [Planctomycetota bacterium]|nr:hypothetical protein [Planctomycetota bacterium]